MESTSFPIAELVLCWMMEWSTSDIVDKLFRLLQDFSLPFRALCFMGLGIINQKYLFPQILQEYVNLVEDVDTKLNLATKFKCHDVVIDVSPQEIRTLS